jgi:molecular chaperone DnaJ
VARDKLFSRDGANILLNVDLDLDVAILGGEVTIPTIDGDVELKIPAGTQPGSKKVLRNRGSTSVSSKRKGDQIVTLNVKIPTGLSSHQKSLLAEAFQRSDKQETLNKDTDTSKEGPFKKFFKSLH